MDKDIIMYLEQYSINNEKVYLIYCIVYNEESIILNNQQQYYYQFNEQSDIYYPFSRYIKYNLLNGQVTVPDSKEISYMNEIYIRQK